MALIYFFAGMMLGGLIGVFVMALMVAARNADDAYAPFDDHSPER